MTCELYLGGVKVMLVIIELVAVILARCEGVVIIELVAVILEGPLI